MEINFLHRIIIINFFDMKISWIMVYTYLTVFILGI